ncbi:MAG TPA: carbohydrate ABC transporter substrate-binding protein, partial [Terrimesophilobacter sp.]|nr:carbohydrate ABC transporter substrate-binding protein [Terrimesophilobacter sp.]
MRSIRYHKSFTALAVAAVTGIALAGCSSGGSSPGPSSPSSTDLSGVTLNVAADWSGAEQANFEKVLAQFTKDTGAKVNYTSYGSNVATTINTKI